MHSVSCLGFRGGGGWGLGFRRVRLGGGWDFFLGFTWRLYWDNGKEKGSYYNGLYRDFRVYIGII